LYPAQLGRQPARLLTIDLIELCRDLLVASRGKVLGYVGG
jgi:hypothetical protein